MPLDFVFVGGYMHSGTSLLAKILGSHSGVRGISGESKFFDYHDFLKKKWDQNPPSSEAAIRNWWKEVFRFTDEPELAEFRGDNSNVPFSGPHEVFIRGGRSLLEAGESVVLEKTPTNVFHADLILEKIPKSKIILIQRDLRGILASKKIRTNTVDLNRYSEAQISSKKLEKDYNILSDGYSWKKAVRSANIATKENQERVLLLSYENLVQKPELLIKEICLFLGIGFESNMLNISFSNPASLAKEKGSGIYSSSTDDWKEILSGQELDLVEYLFGDDLQRSGYELIGNGKFKSHLLKVFPGQMGGLIRRIVKRVQFFGPKDFVIYARNFLRR